MVLDITAHAACGDDQHEMEYIMTSEVGWTNPKGFMGGWYSWSRVFDEITDLRTCENFGRIDTLRVHKALIRALQWKTKQSCTPPECDKLVYWLKICCQYDASLFFMHKCDCPMAARTHPVVQHLASP